MRQRAALALVMIGLFATAVACASKSTTSTGDTTPSSNQTEETMSPTTKKQNTVKEFCQVVTDNESELTSVLTKNVDEVVAALKKLQKKATKQVKKPLDTVVAAVEPIVDLSGGEQADAVSALAEDDGYVAAYKQLSDYIEENCDVKLPKVTATTATSRRSTSTTRPRSTTSTVASAKAKEILDDLQEYLATNYGTAAWIKKADKVGITVPGGSSNLNVKLTMVAGTTAAEAVEACKAAAAYIDQSTFSDGSVSVVDPSGAVLAGRTSKSSPCA